MTTKSHTLASSGLYRCSVSVHNLLVELDSFCEVFQFLRYGPPMQLTLKLKSSQATTKSHTLASSGLTSLYRCSVSVHNLLVELDSFNEVFQSSFFHNFCVKSTHAAHTKTEK